MGDWLKDVERTIYELKQKLVCWSFESQSVRKKMLLGFAVLSKYANLDLIRWQ